MFMEILSRLLKRFLHFCLVSPWLSELFNLVPDDSGSENKNSGQKKIKARYMTVTGLSRRSRTGVDDQILLCHKRNSSGCCLATVKTWTTGLKNVSEVSCQLVFSRAMWGDVELCMLRQQLKQGDKLLEQNGESCNLLQSSGQVFSLALLTASGKACGW